MPEGEHVMRQQVSEIRDHRE